MNKTITLPTNTEAISFQYFAYNGQDGVIAFCHLPQKEPFLRIHSSCLFSESFGTQDCDCSRQLDAAIDYIKTKGGIVIYLYQEGRGIGLKQKIEAINLENTFSMDTAEAFKKLGHPIDPRDYSAVVEILKSMNIKNVQIDTSNPNKIEALEKAGIKITKRLALKITTNKTIDEYKKSKQSALGHHENY